MKRLWCRLTSHRWVERKPHRMWNLNTYDCTRCGATMERGLFSGW